MKELSTSYDILKVLGHGGFSAVFKARRKDDGDIVALKQLDLTIAGEDQKEYRDFREEVDMLKKLDHPNIVKIYDELILDHKPSLEMEFIDGETLETILKRDKCFSISDTLDVVEQIAGALNYCHHYYLSHSPGQQYDSVLRKRSAVVHNDINPKNIIRTKNDDETYRYVLIDFGLSFTDPDAVRHSKKEEGMAEYKSPEKWRGDMVDAPSDIYSFGIVIYELLTGAVPFPVKDYKLAGDMLQLEENHKTAAVPDMCEKRKEILTVVGGNTEGACDIPGWLEELVKKSLEKQPGDRFKTGRELSQFYYDGIEGKIQVPEKSAELLQVIEMDPLEVNNSPAGPRLEVIANFLTEAQVFVLEKDITTVGRYSDAGSMQVADFAIRTGDKFVSKNHCQIIRRVLSDGRTIYQLGDAAPSKNGTFYNTDRSAQRLEPHIRVNLKDGDFFWIGNTQVVFHG